jgi:hypothetical protein
MYIKNFNKNYGALYIVPLFIVLVIISLSFLYFLVNRKISNKQKANNLKQQNINTPINTTTTIKEESLKGELILELGLSSLSRTKGKADIYWDSKEGFSTGKPKIAIATPLDLVDGLKITNNTNKTVLFVEINNENKESLKFLTPKDGWGATPIILLPEKFIKNDKEEIICKNRDLFSESINNICIFSEPIIIKPGETITLSPQLFAVPGDLWEYPPYTRDKITFLENKDSKNHLYLTLKNGKKYIFLSNIFDEYDDISESKTFNVGGFILIDSKNNNFINKVFNFKTIDGQKITPKIKLTDGITIKQFQFPSLESIPEKEDKFNEDVLDWQVFLYRNNFMKKEDINGKYDDKTITAIKKLQKSAGIVETGKIDWATMHVANAFDTGYRYYENYADEAQVFSLDSPQPYFRFFSGGMNQVILNKDFSSSSLIKFIKKDDDCIKSGSKLCGYFLDGTEIDVFLGFIYILNNTPKTQLCTLSNQNGLQIKNFKINPNEGYLFELTADSYKTTPSRMYKLQCGDKYLETELYPRNYFY